LEYGENEKESLGHVVQWSDKK